MMANSDPDKQPACAVDTVPDLESQCCHDLYSNFLNPMPVELRKEARNYLHELSKANADGNGAKEKCKEIILKIEAELGQDHMICDLIARLMAERLGKLCLLDDAVDFIQDRMERTKTEDLGSLLTLSGLYNLSGKYFNKSLAPLKKAIQIAKKDGDPVLQCLVLAKLSCVHWNLQNPEDAEENLNMCLSTLEKCDVEIQTPLSDDAHRLIDIYKTIGYICRVRRDTMQAVKYYRKALEIVEKDEKAIIQLLKLETQIGREFSYTKNKYETKKYCWKAYRRIKKLSENEIFMRNHPLPMVHSLARIAMSLECVEQSNEVLEVKEFLYHIGEKYLTKNHPDVARLAAGCANLCNNLHMQDKVKYYMEKAHEVLEHNASQTDDEFLKTYVREISDAWKLLGNTYSKMGELTQAERCFKEAISANTCVYGMNHPRVSRLHHSLGYLYKRLHKYNEAFTCFKKCKKITEEFDSGNTVFIERMKREMKHLRDLDKSLELSET